MSTIERAEQGVLIWFRHVERMSKIRLMRRIKSKGDRETEKMEGWNKRGFA